VARRDAELGENLGDVVLHPVAGDTEALGNLIVRESEVNEVEHFKLARGEGLRSTVHPGIDYALGWHSLALPESYVILPPFLTHLRTRPSCGAAWGLNNCRPSA
jgi:hypothetical protein